MKKLKVKSYKLKIKMSLIASSAIVFFVLAFSFDSSAETVTSCTQEPMRTYSLADLSSMVYDPYGYYLGSIAYCGSNPCTSSMCYCDSGANWAYRCYNCPAGVSPSGFIYARAHAYGYIEFLFPTGGTPCTWNCQNKDYTVDCSSCVATYNSSQPAYVTNIACSQPSPAVATVCGGKNIFDAGNGNWRCSLCTNSETKACPYTGLSGTENKGICKAGIQTCSNGQWGACQGEVTPVDEVCGDNKDNNCDGNTDEGCVVCEDKDGDGYYAISSTCPQGNDCNDNDASVHPGTAEICDGKDNDCNGAIDEGLSTDADGDGHYTSDSCKKPHDDCNDSNATSYPGADEICGDDIDNNCDGNKDEDCAVDNDGDGYFAIPEGNDPDDNDKDTYPGAPEICDGKDNNGDGNTDEGCCEVAASISPQWVAPQKTSGNTKAEVEARLLKPSPPEGCTVVFGVEAVEGSGGHNHIGGRPTGSLSKNTVTLIGDVAAKAVTYESGEVAGAENIVAVLLDPMGRGIFMEELPINVKIKGFFELGAGDGYVLIGQTNTHPINHYGTDNTLYSLLDLADAYLEDVKGTLRINDISLPWGGAFDLCGQWAPGKTCTKYPKGGHKTHRVGKAVDVSNMTVEGKTVTKKSLIKIIDDLNINVSVLDEGNHFHLTFP